MAWTQKNQDDEQRSLIPDQQEASKHQKGIQRQENLLEMAFHPERRSEEMVVFDGQAQHHGCNGGASGVGASVSLWLVGEACGSVNVASSAPPAASIAPRPLNTRSLHCESVSARALLDRSIVRVAELLAYLQSIVREECPVSATKIEVDFSNSIPLECSPHH